MKEKLLLTFKLSVLSLFLIFSSQALAQCPYPAPAFGTGNAPAVGASINITTCAFAGEHSTINNCVSGQNYVITYTGGTGNYVTIYDNTFAPVAFGPSPVSFTATYTGTYYSACAVTVPPACGTDGSCHTVNWAAPCAPIPAPYTQPFTGTTTPTCWSQSTTTGGPWTFVGTPDFGNAQTIVDHTSGVANNYAWIDFSGTDVGVILTTPEIDVTALTIPELRFWYYSYNNNGLVNPFNILNVEVYNGTSWVTIDVLQGNFGNGWVEFSYVITPYVYSGNLVRARFRAESGGDVDDFDNDLLLDDVSIIEGPPCPGSQNISFSSTTALSTTVSWVEYGTASNWIIEYGLSGFTPGSGTLLPTGTNPTVVSGLTPETTYDFYVYSDCGGSVISSASPVGSMTTPPLCPVPTGLNTTGVTASTANLNWTTGGLETNWEVQWGLDGFLLGSGIVDNISVTPTDALTGLNSNLSYDWYVRAVCDLNMGDGVDTLSYFVGPITFTTSTSCAPVTGLNVTNDNGFEADLGWTAGGLETEWNIQWGESGFTLGGSGATIVTGVVSNPFNIAGLTPGTSYQYYVQAVCGSSDLSTWVGPFTWTSSTFCSAPSGLGTTALSQTTATIDWTENGTSTDWTVEFGQAGFTPGTGVMTAVTGTPTMSLTGLTPDTQYCFYVQSNCGSTSDSSSTWAGPYCFATTSSCPAPSNLNVINITNTAANLIFQAGGTETMWDIEWGNPGFTVDSGMELGSATGTTTNPHYATGLNESAPYHYYVRAVCGGANGNSVWVGPYAFNTQMVNNQPCGAIEIIVNDPQIQHYNTGTTTDAGEPVPPIVAGNCYSQTSWCSTSNNRSVWFTFKAPSTGAVSVTTFGDLTNFRTQIAVYETGDCGIYANYDLLGANTLDPLSTQPPYGSTLDVCGLTSGQTYYLKVDAASTTGPGNFGVAVTSIDPNVSAGTASPQDVCETVGTVDLFTTITGNSTTGGTWYNPSVAPGNELPSMVDFTGVAPGTYPLYYVDGTSCGSDTVATTITIDEAPSAGNDGLLTSCNTHEILLVQQLNGNPSMGGTWTDNDGSGGVNNGILNSFGIPAGTYTYTYTVNSGNTCSDATATVTITLTDCLSIEENDNQLSVYPNPVLDVLTIQNLSIDNATLEVYDAQGKVVYSNQLNGVYGNYTIDMTSVESGVYIVRISSENSVSETRIVKQ